MESWNDSFKVEAIHGEKFITRSNAKNQVFDYIDVYYNQNVFILDLAMYILKRKMSLS